MILTKEQTVYTFIGAVGVALAHWIYYKRQNEEYNKDHVTDLVTYWTIGAIAYWILLNQSGYKL